MLYLNLPPVVDQGDEKSYFDDNTYSQTNSNYENRYLTQRNEYLKSSFNSNGLDLSEYQSYREVTIEEVEHTHEIEIQCSIPPTLKEIECQTENVNIHTKPVSE